MTDPLTDQAEQADERDQWGHDHGITRATGALIEHCSEHGDYEPRGVDRDCPWCRADVMDAWIDRRLTRRR